MTTRDKYIDADGDCLECGHPANGSSGGGKCDSPAHGGSRRITEINVYWDTQDPHDEGWAYRVYRGQHEESGPIDGPSDDLDGAIQEACLELDMDLEPHDFAREPNIDGGYATWKSEAQ